MTWLQLGCGGRKFCCHSSRSINLISLGGTRTFLILYFTIIQVCAATFTLSFSLFDSKNVKRKSNYVSFISTRLFFVAVLQKVCMCSPASGTTVRTTVSMAATVKRLNKPVSSFSMVTEEFSMMTSSQLFEPSTRPSRRYGGPTKNKWNITQESFRNVLLGMITMASKTFLDGIKYISPYKGFGYVYDRHGHLKNQMQEVTQNDFVSFADIDL